MTALAAWWGASGESAGEHCGRMVSAQAVYGPDGQAVQVNGTVALGRCLSRLLPEDRHDQGPVTSADGRYMLVADARIDNRDELATALGLSAAHAATLAEPALILAAIERWGDAAIARLVGDFALVLWDDTRRHLLLARDFLGQRPLSYHRGAGFVAVASMPKGLHALAEIPRAPREQALIEFLAGVPQQGREGFFAGIQRVEPGHIVRLTPDEVTSQAFWSPPTEPLRFARDSDYADGLREQLDRATASRLRRAGGNVGSHLSAGRDSSAVTTSAALLLGREGARLTAYTAVPKPEARAPTGRLGDEGPIAAAVAALYRNIDHQLVRSDDRSPLASLDRNVFLFERPVLNLCNLTWSEAIADHAEANGISVMLTGQLGNPTISHDGMPHLPALLGRGRLVALFRLLRGLRGDGMRWRGGVAAAAGGFLPARLWNEVARRRAAPVTRFAALTPSAVTSLGEQGIDGTAQPWRDGVARRLAILRGIDLGEYHKGLLGGWGVDYRDPTADRRLAEYCLRIPEEQFILGGERRSLARHAFGERLPAALLDERRGGFQGADWHIALARVQNDARDEVERIASSEAAPFLDLPRLEALIDHWPTTDTAWESQASDYRRALLRGLSAGHFARRASGSNA
ncbi:MAG: asparagine synthase [Sphingomonas bacterium]|nr:asparagine synthase [Sphingomonas bacterium]